jgi:hypothetical protein
VISATENSNIGFGHLFLAYTNIPNSKVLLKKKTLLQDPRDHSKVEDSHGFLQRDLEERKICKRRFGKKNFPPRGGLEERKICKSFLEGRILQEELCNKQFCEKLQRILQEGALEEDSRILQKKKK